MAIEPGEDSLPSRWCSDCGAAIEYGGVPYPGGHWSWCDEVPELRKQLEAEASA